STCFRSSLGDIRHRSGPMAPVSSGTLPGQISMTSGLSAAATGQTRDIHASRKNVDAGRIVDRDLSYESRARLPPLRALGQEALLTMTKLQAAIFGAIVIAGGTASWVLEHQAQVKLHEENQSL